MLQTVWNELDYRVDVCRITKGAHMYRAAVRYVPKTWSVVLLNKKSTYTPVSSVLYMTSC